MLCHASLSLFYGKEGERMSGIIDISKIGHECRICGKKDWCGEVHFPSGDTLIYCHRVIGLDKGEVVTGTDGEDYIVFNPETQGGFEVYEELSEWQKNREDWLAENGYKVNKTQGSSCKRTPAPSFVSEELPVEDVAETAKPERLDEVYNAFLDLLVLEPKHEKKLRAEWDLGKDSIGIGYEEIMGDEKIRSLPPEDFLRFDSEERLQNKSRKKIMESLVEEIGEPYGVPGFYQRKDGTWTFYRLSGIAYPSKNSYGQIVRIRVNDDYPVCKGTFHDTEGQFTYLRPKGTEHQTGWYFIPLGENGRLDYENQTLVYRYGADDNQIKLSWKGYPEGSDVSGKYKNFSSYIEREERDKQTGKVLRRYNQLKNGCQSRSIISVTRRDGDNPNVCIITEGEKKALVANAAYHVPVINILGVGNYRKLWEPEEGYDKSMMQRLYEMGLRTPIIIFDADKAENKMVAANEYKAITTFWDRSLEVYRGNFNESWGKGLDDITLQGVRFIPQHVKRPADWESSEI